MKAISVRQPWAWLLFHGKPVENRDWWTGYRGLLAIHAAKGMTRCEYDDALDFVYRFNAPLAKIIPSRSDLVYGAVIGSVTQSGCVTEHPSLFFQGKFGHVYESALLLPAPMACRGALSLWDCPEDIVAAIREQRNGR